MDYWTYTTKDERTRSNCNELATIDINSHLSYEQNRNLYLEQKNESLRMSNQQFASCQENLRMQINELFQEKTALFQKNVSLLYKLNNLKKEVITYKEMLCKTSSKNKTLLLSVKTSYDDLVRNMKHLDEFISRIPQNNDNLLFGECDNENEPRFKMTSPQWDRIYPIDMVLSPVPEENSVHSFESNASGRKKRLTSESLKRSDKTKDENVDKFITEWGSYKKIKSRAPSREPSREITLNKDLTTDRIIEKIDTPERNTKSKSLIETDLKNNMEINIETIDKTYTIVSQNSGSNVEENINTFGYTVKYFEKQNTNERESSLSHNIPDLISTKSREPRCFYPPLPNEIENNHQIETCFPATPVSKRSSIKLLGTPMHRQKLSSLKNSLFFNTKENDVELMNQEKFDNFDETSVSKSSLTKDKSTRAKTSKCKKKVRDSNHENCLEKGKKKRKKSVFEVSEYFEGDPNKNNKCTEENLLNLDNDNDNEIKLRSRQCKNNCVVLQPSTKVNGRQKTNFDEEDHKEIIKNVRSKKAEFVAPDNTCGVKTRSKRRREAQENKENYDNCQTNFEYKKPDQGTLPRVRSKRLKTQKVKDKLTGNAGTKAKSDKNGTRPSSIVPISTPNSINKTSDSTDFNELSMSPIGKLIQDNEQKTRGNLNEPMINPNNENNYPCKDQVAENPKKLLILADILKSTANNKQATKSDIARIKKFFSSLVTSDKKTNKLDNANDEPPDSKDSPREDSGISSNSAKDNINSFISTLSPSLASLIKSFDIHDNSTIIEV